MHCGEGNSLEILYKAVWSKIIHLLVALLYVHYRANY